MIVLEPGPGMGFFTIPMARLVGASGRVIAVDLQPKMIQGLKRRAQKANVREHVDARVSSADNLSISDLEGRVDFTLAFAVVHEFPDAAHFFKEVSKVCKPNAQLLLAEPKGHVDEENFAAELSAAAAAGFSLAARPEISRSISALLVKS